jgi:hypothetical protein
MGRAHGFHRALGAMEQIRELPAFRQLRAITFEFQETPHESSEPGTDPYPADHVD